MATTIFSEVAYAPLAGTGEFSSGVLAAGADGFEITATINGIAQEGLRFEPTAAGEVPMIFYCPGGAGGSRSLDDHKAVGNTDGAGAPPAGDLHTGLSGMTQWDGGYSVVAWVSRGSSTTFNGSVGTAGVDGFGDPDSDVDDLAQAYYASLNFDKVDAKRTILLGSSRGAMDAMQMMIHKGITPDICILRAPLIKLEDWSEQQYGPASIPGFSDPGMTDPDLRTLNDQKLLTARTPSYRVQDLPKTTKFLILIGSADPTIPRSWAEEAVALLTGHGIHAELVIVPGGDHAMLTGAAAQYAAQAQENFVEKYLPSAEVSGGGLTVTEQAGYPTANPVAVGDVNKDTTDLRLHMGQNAGSGGWVLIGEKRLRLFMAVFPVSQYDQTRGGFEVFLPWDCTVKEIYWGRHNFPVPHDVNYWGITARVFHGFNNVGLPSNASLAMNTVESTTQTVAGGGMSDVRAHGQMLRMNTLNQNLDCVAGDIVTLVFTMNGTHGNLGYYGNHMLVEIELR